MKHETPLLFLQINYNSLHETAAFCLLIPFPPNALEFRGVLAVHAYSHFVTASSLS